MQNHPGAWDLAGEQKLLITDDQLSVLGFTRSAIRHRRCRGRLRDVFPGVYAVGPSEITPPREALAAVLACGPGAALSLHSAAANLRLREGTWPRRHDVSIPDRRRLELPDAIHVHRPRELAADVFVFESIPTTTVVRTIVDCAGQAHGRAIKTMIRHAQREHGLPLEELRAYLDEYSTKSFRHQRVRRVLDTYLARTALTDSERESLFLDLCARHGLPAPQAQRWIAGFRVDFVWPAHRLIVELDDRGSHELALAFTDDRVRDRALRLAGYTVIRFTVAELLSRPARVADELGRILALLAG